MTRREDAAGQSSGSAPASAEESAPERKTYQGFVAGVFSGIAKLSVGHPFDTVKVRLQTASRAQFSGPLECVVQTVRQEGVRGLYKGATPPLAGWMFTDSLMLGSLTTYRRLLNERVFNKESRGADARLPTRGHALAGVMAGWTVSFIAAPVEHVKARLQTQYSVDKAQRTYSGPVDCAQKLFRSHGVPGLYRGLSASVLFRSFFFFWWGSYDVLTRFFQAHTALSLPAVNFWAGGLSAQIFWLTAYPSDVVKQRVMTSPLDSNRPLGWKQAAMQIYRDGGLGGYWRGFLPCFLRAFPANSVALVAFEGVLRALP